MGVFGGVGWGGDAALKSVPRSHKSSVQLLVDDILAWQAKVGEQRLPERVAQMKAPSVRPSDRPTVRPSVRPSDRPTDRHAHRIGTRFSRKNLAFRNTPAIE